MGSAGTTMAVSSTTVLAQMERRDFDPAGSLRDGEGWIFLMMTRIMAGEEGQ